MRSWKKKVYHLPIRQKLQIKSKHWLSMRKKVFTRDRFQCQRCKKFFGENGVSLSAHHIIPRPKGKTILSNLLTLCTSCHDLVEVNGLDFEFIKGDMKVIAKEKDWHKWVYGGYARPQDKIIMPLLPKNGTLKSVRQRLIASQQLREE